jgi:hypothetical protein
MALRATFIEESRSDPVFQLPVEAGIDIGPFPRLEVRDLDARA